MHKLARLALIVVPTLAIGVAIGIWVDRVRRPSIRTIPPGPRPTRIRLVENPTPGIVFTVVVRHDAQRDNHTFWTRTADFASDLVLARNGAPLVWHLDQAIHINLLNDALVVSESSGGTNEERDLIFPANALFTAGDDWAVVVRVGFGDGSPATQELEAAVLPVEPPATARGAK